MKRMKDKKSKELIKCQKKTIIKNLTKIKKKKPEMLNLNNQYNSYDKVQNQYMKAPKFQVYTINKYTK